MSDHRNSWSLLRASLRRAWLVVLVAVVSLLAPLAAAAHDNYAPATASGFGSGPAAAGPNHHAAAFQHFSFLDRLELQLPSSQAALRPSATSLASGFDPAPPWSPADYDGKALTTDAPDLTTLPTFHTVYIYPADGVNRFSQFAAMFQRDARAASNVLTTLYGRAIRFDERLGDDGATRYLDITVLQSSHTAAELAAKPLALVIDELAARGFTKANTKYFVWLEIDSTRFCGLSQSATDNRRRGNTNDGLRTVSMAVRVNDPASPDTGGFCSYRTVLHELTHAMGAVQVIAPNSYGSHCIDSGNDVMCLGQPTRIPYSPDAGLYYDYGLDDYWDPIADPTSGSKKKLRWWTVNLSKFICPRSGCSNPSTPEY